MSAEAESRQTHSATLQLISYLTCKRPAREDINSLGFSILTQVKLLRNTRVDTKHIIVYELIYKAAIRDPLRKAGFKSNGIVGVII